MLWPFSNIKTRLIRRCFTRSKAEGGYSLLELMVAVGIVGILTVIFQNAFKDSKKIIDEADKSKKLELVQLRIRYMLDCDKTMSMTSTCTSGQKLTLRNKNGDDIFAALPTGVNEMKVTCGTNKYDLTWKVRLSDDTKDRVMFTDVPFGC
jgi:prepilin-type N-terminal cleavage/methylation domain-containing protein